VRPNNLEVETRGTLRPSIEVRVDEPTLASPPRSGSLLPMVACTAATVMSADNIF
jgi:hypothetical protein